LSASQTIRPGKFGSGESSANKNLSEHRAHIAIPNVGWPLGSR